MQGLSFCADFQFFHCTFLACVQERKFDFTSPWYKSMLVDHAIMDLKENFV